MPVRTRRDLIRPRRELAKTADYTVLVSQNGTLFTNTGALGTVIFTLPPMGPSAIGCEFEFRAVADFTMKVISNGSLDDIHGFNNIGIDTLSFETGAAILGAHIRVTCNAAGTLWYVTNMSAGANTLTVS